MFRSQASKFQQQIGELTQQLNVELDYRRKLESRLDDALSLIEESAGRMEACKQQIAKHDSVVTNLKANHKTAMASLEASVNRKVNASLASIGVTQFAPESFTVSNVTTDRSLLDTFNSLEGVAKTDFYAKHKDAIGRLLLGHVSL